MKLLIIYPSRGRRDLFFKTLDNLQETIGSKNYSVIVNCDKDDLSMNNEEVKNKVKEYYNVTIYFNEPVSKVFSCNANIDKGGSFDWLLLMSDDFKFAVNDWYSKMVTDIKKMWGVSLDFFAHYNDGFVGNKLPTMNICGYTYYKRDNNIYDPSYGSVSCDAENFFKAQMRGRHHYFDKIYFKHLHPSNLRTASDETYRGNDRFGKSDTDNYFKRMKELFYVENPIMIPQQLKEEIEKLK